MSPNPVPRRPRRLALAPLGGAMLALAGCGALGGGGLLGSLLGGAGPGFTGGSGGGLGPASPGSIPNLQTGGLTPNPAPSSMLPPPPQSQAAAAEILQRYGVRISGSGATPENLQQVATGLRHYKPEQLQGLGNIDIPAVQSHNLNGLWEGGGSARITYWAHQSRRPQVLLHTVAHELGHHVTLQGRRDFGQAFNQALGEYSSSIPRSYAGTNWREKVADNLAFILLGSSSELQPQAQWRPPAPAMQLVQTEFAGRPAY